MAGDEQLTATDKILRTRSQIRGRSLIGRFTFTKVSCDATTYVREAGSKLMANLTVKSTRSGFWAHFGTCMKIAPVIRRMYQTRFALNVTGGNAARECEPFPLQYSNGTNGSNCRLPRPQGPVKNRGLQEGPRAEFRGSGCTVASGRVTRAGPRCRTQNARHDESPRTSGLATTVEGEEAYFLYKLKKNGRNEVKIKE